MRQKLTTLCLALTLMVLLFGVAQADPRVLRPGDEELDGSKLQPFEARYDLALFGEVQAQRKIRLHEAKVSGESGLFLTKTMEHAETMLDEVQFVRSSQRPVTHSIVSVEHAHHVEVWDGTTVRGFRIEADGSAAEKIEIPSDGERFAGTQYPLMLASFPLAKGQALEIPLVVSMLGAERANTTAKLVVKGREDLEAKNGRKYSTWVIDSNLVDAEGNPVRPPTTYWLADEAPYIIKSDTGGGRMVQELVEAR